MKQIIENINSYKLKSADPLKNQQIAYIPTVNDDQIECMVFSYLIDGKRTLINQSTQACFKLHYLKFKPMLPRKYIVMAEPLSMAQSSESCRTIKMAYGI